MPRESLGFVRMVWVCPNCQNKNPGNFRFCRGCGAPQPAGVQFQQDAGAQILTDPKEIAQAAAGADIHCGFCGARNPATNKECASCGADLATGARRESGTVLGAYAAAAVPQVPCPNCGTPNPADAMQCKSCGASLGVTAPAAPSAQTPARKFPAWLIAVIVAGVLCLVVGGIMLLSRTSDVQASVADRSWQRIVSIQALQPVQRSDWQPDLPAGVQPQSCERRLYTTADQPQGSDSVKVCGEPYTVDRGNGYAEVVQDCQYEIYEDYCSYTVQEWQQVNQLVEQGSDQRPSWPVVSLAQGQREGEREEVYTIVFQTQDGEKTFRTRDEQLYLSAARGTQWSLVINAFGEIIDIQPAQ